MSEVFEYRTVLGCWVNDVASIPRVEPWPSIVLDAQTEQDLVTFFEFMKEARLNSIVLFGLLVSRYWESDFASSVSPERKERVKRILHAAGERGIKVLYGLGLYSWGFEKIIEADPTVRGTNPEALCGSKEASHRKMEELVDYLLSTFPFDGFHFESMDQGRCECDQCRERSDLAYHIALNERVAHYVRSEWPGKIIEVYCSAFAGVHRSREDWLQWSEASKHFDYIIDDCNTADRFGCHARKDIIAALRCPYGTRSGFWVYPPQRWDRLRWFLPVIERRAVHYRGLAADGGKAIMVQAGPLVNPGEEATLRCSAKFLQDPFGDPQSVLCETMTEMFAPRSPAVAEELSDLFWYAEKSYFANATFYPEGGELMLEPLFGGNAGAPVYLQDRVSERNLSEYEEAIKNIQRRFSRIRREMGEQDKAGRVETCLLSILKDIETIKRG